MRASKLIFLLIISILFCTGKVFSQNEASNTPVVFEAESGEIGYEFDIIDGYISISTNFDETSGSASYPGVDRTAIYEIVFPDTGIYDLFARVRVGPGSFDDDSFFYGNDFGEKDAGNGADWILCNGLASAGFTENDDVVRDAGGSGNNVWKWVNLSKNAYQAANRDFTVDTPDDLARIFQIGARENGLDFDKFAFGKSKLFFTVNHLDNGLPGSETDPNENVEPPPREPLAKDKSKYLGMVWSPTQLYRFTEYWNQVIPGNPGKWGSVEGTRDQMSWGPLDEAYALAKENGFSYRHHVLVWGNQQPEWMETLPVAEQLEEIEEWFNAVADRYPEIDVLEVVNEPLHDPPNKDDEGGGNYIKALGGDNDLYGTGWDWVIKSFEMARSIFPASTMLILNEYNVPNSNANTTNYLNIIELLKERDLIDGIGVQGHAFSTRGSMATVSNNLNRLAETGLPVIVTEMNIDGGEVSPTEEDQLNDYKRIFPTFWEHPGVVGISLSGWRPGMGNADAILMNNNGSERPAMEWLSTYVDTVQLQPISSVRQGINGPEMFCISENYPNPFNPVTNIQYEIANEAHVNLQVIDVSGRLVTTLVNITMPKGAYEIKFNASALPSGIYLYRFQAGGFKVVKRMNCIK